MLSLFRVRFHIFLCARQFLRRLLNNEPLLFKFCVQTSATNPAQIPSTRKTLRRCLLPKRAWKWWRNVGWQRTRENGDAWTAWTMPLTGCEKWCLRWATTENSQSSKRCKWHRRTSRRCMICSREISMRWWWCECSVRK